MHLPLTIVQKQYRQELKIDEMIVKGLKSVKKE